MSSRPFLVAAVLAWIVAGLATPAAAHTTGTTGYAAVTVGGQTVRYVLTLATEALPPGDAGALDRLPAAVAAHVAVIADGRPCEAVPQAALPPQPGRTNVVIEVLYACAAPVGDLLIRDGMSDLLGGGHHTIAGIEWPGGREQLVFSEDQREGRVRLDGRAPGAAPGTAAPSAEQATGGFATYLGLGVEHILLGFDHVLFVVALILQGGRLLSVLAIVTAFTLAHSVTLALSVLGVVMLPGQIVEPVIALSIAYVAAENLFLRERAISRRWAVSFLFGLVHGFGFAGALREVGLPLDGLVPALLGFNLGVEAGQALIVAVLLPALLWFQRFAWQGRAVRVTSAAIMAAGLMLLVERALLSGA